MFVGWIGCGWLNALWLQGRKGSIAGNDGENFHELYIRITLASKKRNERKISLQGAKRLLNDMFEKIAASLSTGLHRRKSERH